jgi:hypothetical protein
LALNPTTNADYYGFAVYRYDCLLFGVRALPWNIPVRLPQGSKNVACIASGATIDSPTEIIHPYCKKVSEQVSQAETKAKQKAAEGLFLEVATWIVGGVVGKFATKGIKAAIDLRQASRAKAAYKILSTVEAASAIKTARRVGSAAKKTDLYHSPAAEVFDQVASRAQSFRYVNDNGEIYTLVQMAASVNGKSGSWEWLVNSAGEITHEFFRKGLGVTGKYME